MGNKRLTLDDFAPRAPVRSEVFEFKGRRRRWRLLDVRETDWARAAAMARTFRVMIDQFGEDHKDVVIALMNGHDAARGDSFEDWTDIYCLSAAMCDENGAPVHLGGPDKAAGFIADAYTPTERAELIRMYLEFVDEHDPATISETDAKEVIGEVGKSQDSSSLRQLGSNALRSLLLTSAVELMEAQARADALEEELKGYREMDGLEQRLAALEQRISAMLKSSGGSG